MYVDEVVVAGIAIVILTCGVVVGVGCFAYRHFKEEVGRPECYDNRQV